MTRRALEHHTMTWCAAEKRCPRRWESRASRADEYRARTTNVRAVMKQSALASNNCREGVSVFRIHRRQTTWLALTTFLTHLLINIDIGSSSSRNVTSWLHFIVIAISPRPLSFRRGLSVIQKCAFHRALARREVVQIVQRSCTFSVLVSGRLVFHAWQLLLTALSMSTFNVSGRRAGGCISSTRQEASNVTWP